MYVYAQLGIHLSHFSGAQWNEGTPIAAEDLAPGDLVFFHPGANGPGHVGIYIGGNNFIHAPHTGDVVKISSLYEYSDELRRRRAAALDGGRGAGGSAPPAHCDLCGGLRSAEERVSDPPAGDDDRAARRRVEPSGSRWRRCRRA